MIFASIIISLIYVALILFFVKGFYSLKKFDSKNDAIHSNFSIVVPFRNEESNLKPLLESISQLKYSVNKFELLLVNDYSNDDSVNLIQKFQAENPTINIQIIDQKEKTDSPKKEAIETAIKASKFEWIITTDADCIVPENWLNSMDQFIQIENPKMIVAPVKYKMEDTFINKFQVLDFLSLQGATMAGFGADKPFLCNGANLCYNKNCFKEIKGFSGNKKIASGDDIFVLEKMLLKYPNQVKYLKSDTVIIETKTQKNWTDLIQQRVRWASKTTSYKNTFGKWVGSIIFMMNSYLFVLLTLVWFDCISWQHLGWVFLLKFNLDFLLLYRSALFFNQLGSLRSYYMSSLIYPLFCVYVVILSSISKYQWKGRSYSK